MPSPTSHLSRSSFIQLTWALSLLAGCGGDAATQPSKLHFGEDDDAGTGLVCASCGGCEEQRPVASAQHVVGTVAYPDNPPVGGPHSQCWTEWGVHDSEVRAERWVHNLEHGGVVLLYRCDDGCDADVQRLRDFVAGHAGTVLTAYSALPQRFAAVAWGYRIVSDCLDLTAIARFYAEHIDQGPERGLIGVPPDVVCAERPNL